MDRSDDCALGNAIYLDYLVAKRRWRGFSGKPPRRYRRFTTRRDIRHKQRSRLSRGPYAQTFASFLPPNAFAGGQGKGKGKGKGKGFRKNPKGKDGRALLCATCGSDTHLWRQCPKSSSAGNGQSSSPPSMAMSTSVLPGVSFNYMTNDAAEHLSAPDSWTGVAQDVHRRVPEEFTIASQSGSGRSSSGYDVELESLRSVATSNQSKSKRIDKKDSKFHPYGTSSPAVSSPSQAQVSSARTDAVETGKARQVMSSPMVESFMQENLRLSSVFGSQSSASGSSSMFPFSFVQGSVAMTNAPILQGSSAAVELKQSSHEEEQEEDHPGPSQVEHADEARNSPAASPMYHTPERSSTHYGSAASSPAYPSTNTPPAAPTPGAPQKRRLNLSELLAETEHHEYPWWENMARSSSPQADPMAYHVRTRVDGKVGLLVDPGAHDNLIGSETCELMARQLGSKAVSKSLDRPIMISGVGKNSQSADSSSTVDCCFRTIDGQVIRGTYTAPVAPDSSLLRAKDAVVDTKTPALILPGPGGIECRLSPGSRIHRLEMSDSGHLILPLSSPGSDASGSSSDNKLDFVMQRRRNRSVSRSPSPGHDPQ